MESMGYTKTNSCQSINYQERANTNLPPFDELKMLRFKSSTKSDCFNKENTFKKAAKLHAVNGILLSGVLVFLFLFVYFFVFLPIEDCQGQPCYLYITLLLPLVVYGVVFLLLSIFLLLMINNNDIDGVFRTIKVGCLALALLDVIGALTTTVYEMKVLIQEENIKTEKELEIIIVVTVSICHLTMSALVIGGIFCGTIAVVTAYIIYRYLHILELSIICFSCVYLIFSEDMFIYIVFLLVFGLSWLSFHIVFFVLHLNAMEFVQKSQDVATFI